jgi:hypothetical protein
VYNGNFTFTTLKISHFSHCLNCIDSLTREDSTPQNVVDIGSDIYTPGYYPKIGGDWNANFLAQKLAVVCKFVRTRFSKNTLKMKLLHKFKQYL